jgi:two-component system, LytTR family, sensor kinase
LTLTAANRRRAVLWVIGTLAVCAALSLREALVAIVEQSLAPGFVPDSRVKWAVWWMLFYLMWGMLAPAIFALARRVPFDRRHWIRPLGVHLACSIIASVCGPIALVYAFGAVSGGFDPSAFPPLRWSYWGPFATLSMVAYTHFYWVIVAAALGLDSYDAAQARLREAAELERTLVAAEVDALKMRLQPHFLFNTLNSMRFLAVEKDADAVVRMVQRLGALLRSTMQSNGRHLVTVGEELALLEQYLAIEEIRFADRLTVSRRIAPEVIHALIPSLLLQPMIENSIKHGFSRRIDAGRLEIAIARERDWLVVTVEDDGPGLPAGWDLATHCGRGLKNVIERLEKLYPGAWSFTLRNRPGGGAVSRLRIPWQVAPSLELLVLSVLAHCPRHGHEIGRLIERASGGHLTFRITTLYPALYRLENRGLIAGRWVERAGERRRCYYHLTEAGKTVLEEQRELWGGFAAAVGRVARGDSHA